MAQVTNLTDRTVSFLRWRVLPRSSKLLNPKGEVCASMPDALAYSAVAKQLADQGLLELEGYNRPVPPLAPSPTVDLSVSKDEPVETSRKKNKYFPKDQG